MPNRNSRGRPNRGSKVERGRGVERDRVRFPISKPLALLLAGIAAAALVLGGCEYQVRQENKAVTEELLRGTKFNREIEGIEIYVDNSSMRENEPLLKELIERLEPIISILPDEMVRRIRFIVLETSSEVLTLEVSPGNSIPVPFEAVTRIDVGGMKLAIYPKNIDIESQETENRLIEIVSHEAVHSASYGNPRKPFNLPFNLMFLRKIELDKCKDASLEICIESVTDLIDKPSLRRWLQISRQNGGYAYTGRIPISQIRGEKLIKQKNFGYMLDNHDIDYGRLNLAEDIACVFEKILSSLYKVIHRNENPKEVIIALLSKTPGETGLYEKYLIACKSLIKWYQEGSRQHEILREFIQIIEDVIKAGGTTGVQTTSVELLMRRLAEIREEGRTTNGQGTSVESIIRRRLGPGRISKSQIVEALKQTQTIGDAIKAEGITNGQGRSIESLRRRLYTIRKSVREGLS
jgi:hypothetical protein